MCSRLILIAEAIHVSFYYLVYAEHYVTRIILRPLSALSLDEVNIAKRNITTGLFGLNITQIVFNLK